MEWVRMGTPISPRLRIKKDEVGVGGELMSRWLADMWVQGGHANGPSSVRATQIGPKYRLEF